MKLKNISFYTWILLAFLVAGIVSGLLLVKERHYIEAQQEQIENIIDYDGLLRANAYEKRSLGEAIVSAKEAGITALAIYDRTLQKETDAGHIRMYTSNDLERLQITGVQPGTTYIGMIPGKEAYFQEVQDDLLRRLGQNKVHILQTDLGPMLGLALPSDSLKDMNLGISRLQAEEVAKLGFHVIVRPTNYKGATVEDVDHVFQRIDGISGVTGMIFVGKEALGYPLHVDRTLEQLEKRQIPLVGIEAVNQLQYFPQAGFLEMANANHYKVGRLYTVSKEEVRKLTPAELIQWFYISDIERNIRYNLFPIYEQGVDNKTALETTLFVAKQVTDKLQARGFTTGEASVYPVYFPNTLLRLLTMTGVISLATLTLGQLVHIRKSYLLGLFALGSIVSVGIYILTTGTKIMSAWALVAAISAPVLAMTMIFDCWSKRNHTGISPWRSTLESVVYLVVAALIAAIGGISIAAMLGSTQFFMEFALFRGVKLTFVAPVLLTAIAYLQRFPIWKGRTISSVSDVKSFITEFVQIDIKVYSLLIVGSLAVVAYVFVGRSGHTAGVPVPSWELALRRFLENTMYARPREKEFLIGHPVFMLAAYAVGRRIPMVMHFALSVAAVIGIASMVETFCHLRTPVYMSIARGYDGLLLGIVIGLVAIIAVRFIGYGIRWFQGRGESHV
ncbi:DUF5693 family protein [Veillonella sp. 3913]|uniref:DUF5693 family protein n=1 Tax=Veillonella sp. 3913 TaxID=2490952 RepID=UPI000F8D3646|nr:DUF5693 family protein [Veillonella sp. 3913]